ncbi:MAG: hypothetical protein BGO41_00680 [Clostridiales bacterium 38-18]|nr:MAG: hypothetical protein BGO41_00680 [Clostridiales bacterium 38-18]
MSINWLKKIDDPMLRTSDFMRERNTKNAAHGKVLAVGVLMFEVVFMIIAIVSRLNGISPSFNYDFYMGMYISLIVVSIVFYGLLKRYDPSRESELYQRNFYRLTVGFGYLFILWGMLVSFADQGMYSNLNALFINLIAIASFLYIAPRNSLFMFAAEAVIFFVFISRFQASTDILLGHYVNSTVIFVFVWLASFLSYNIFTSNYLNKSQLQVQLDVNNEINEQLQDVVDRLEALVIEDSLTGLPNRRGMDKFLKNIVSVYKADQTTISFLMIDIDYFKQYNDHYTHMAGDDTLKRISGKLNEFVTSLNDYVIRFGGEEFLFINVSKSREEMIAIAERMRREIEALEIEHMTSECSSYVTISIGLVTEQSGNLEWINQQISAADKALYKAKELGRNQVYVME